MVDTVAQDLSTVKEELDKVKTKYIISMTHPTSKLSNLDEDCLYVIRQRIDIDGVYHLIAAAKNIKGNCLN